MRRLICGKVFIGKSQTVGMTDWFRRLKDAFLNDCQIGEGRSGMFFVEIKPGVVVADSAGDMGSHQTPPKLLQVQFGVNQGEIGQQRRNLDRFNFHP
jgi:hypothetical protein